MTESPRHELSRIVILVDEDNNLHANFQMPPGATDEMLEDIRTIYLQALEQGIEAYQQEEESGD